MKKPWVVGVLSIVPGLGLIALRRTVLGLASIASILMLGFLAMLDLSATFSLVALAVGLIVWVFQAYYGVVLAQRTERASAGKALTEREVPMARLQPGASLAEKRAYQARKAVMQLLPPGEDVTVAIHVSTNTTPVGLSLLELATGVPSELKEIRQLYLAATQHDFILVNLDGFGKPSHLQRLPLKNVKLDEFKQGVLSDVLTLSLGTRQPLRVGVATMMRHWTSQLAELISQ
jgi:hypothetical protein